MAQQQKPEPVIRFPVFYFGGVNYRDQGDQLIPQSHRFNGNSWSQVSGLQSPDMQNMDFYPQGIGKRLGSATTSTLTYAASDTQVLHEVLFVRPADNITCKLAITDTSIYLNTGSGWNRLTYSSALNYTHAATVAKCTTTAVDGGLIIGLDGGNTMKRYRAGTALDDNMWNSATTTTVNVTSNSGQKVLSVAATTMFNVGDRVRINSGGARDETGYIDTIQVGTSITLHSNLGFTHTNVQADVVQTANLYTNAYGGNSTNVYTGTWSTGQYILTGCRNRLCFTDGNTLVNFTPAATPGSSSGIWDLTNQGFFSAKSRIYAMTSFTPQQSNQITEDLYVSTQRGWEVAVGFQAGIDQLQLTFGFPCASHRSFCTIKNWIVYLTASKTLRAVSGQFDIDLGQRYKNVQFTGPLDSMDVAASSVTSFGVYHPILQQAWMFFSSSSAAADLNGYCLVMDFKLGEPVYGEPQEGFEQRVRPLVWTLKANSNTNGWFSHAIWNGTQIEAPVKTGPTGTTTAAFYVCDSGYYDLDTIPTQEYWKTPYLNGGDPVTSNQWLRLFVRTQPVGQWYLYVDTYLNRSATPITAVYSFRQINAGTNALIWGVGKWGVNTWGGSGTVRGTYDVMTYADAIQLQFRNQIAGQSWIMTGLELDYLQGARFS